MEQPLQYREEVQPKRKRRRKRRERCKRHPKDGPHSPSCRMRNVAYSINSSGNLVRILPSFKPVLDYLNVTGETFTREQIMGHLTEYIKQKCLFDPTDPRKVYCENDELGVIFGCSEFSTANACELLLQNLEVLKDSTKPKPDSIPLKPAACSSSSCCSSTCTSTFISVSTTDTCSCSESDHLSASETFFSKYVLSKSKNVCIKRPGTKRTHENACSDSSHASRQPTVPPPSRDSNQMSRCLPDVCERSNTSFSQSGDADVDCTKSTSVSGLISARSDDLPSTSGVTNAPNPLFSIPGCASTNTSTSLSGRTSQCNSSDTASMSSVTSGPGNSSTSRSNVNHTTGAYDQHYKCVCENMTDVVTDTSDDLFFLNETDEERVVTYDTVEDQVLEEFEPLSFTEEEGFFSESDASQDEEISSLDTEVDEGEDGGDELDINSDTDSEIEQEDKWQCDSCSERNHPMTRHCRKCWKIRSDWYPAALTRSTSDPVSVPSTNREPDDMPLSDSASTHHTILQTDEGNINRKCAICNKEPRDGCIIHGRTGHQVCCVGCAQRLKETGQPCPVCRRKIRFVIKNYL